jgi:hypothetical protein
VVLNNIVSEVGIALTVNSAMTPSTPSWFERLGSERNIYHAASGARGEPIVINNQKIPLGNWQKSGNECNTVDTDPAFVNPLAHDYQTQPTSPARDAAVPISGSAQVVYGNGPDIGAIETP